MAANKPVARSASFLSSNVLEEVHDTDNRAVPISNRIDVNRDRDAAPVRPFDHHFLLMYGGARAQYECHWVMEMRHFSAFGMVEFVSSAEAFIGVTHRGDTTPKLCRS